jgi:ABC-type uncharacterized transport system substrate-binding protein
MKRRMLLLAGGAWLAAAVVPALPQAPKLRRIAFLHPGSYERRQLYFEAFRTALKELGYVEGRDIAIEARWAEQKLERLPALAAEVVASKPDVIVTATSAAVTALKKETASIPIVFATAGNPVEQGFVSSFQRPGGNITGVVLFPGMTQKAVELAREALPAARRLAVFSHEVDPASEFLLEGVERSARRLKFEPLIVPVKGPNDLDRAFARLAKSNVEVLIVPQLSLFQPLLGNLAARSVKARLSLVGSFAETADAGGLLSYGTPREDNFRRAAALVDKILRGAKPGDLPVEQPQRFQLVVNRRTAKAIGVTLSPVVILRADRIID